MKKEKPDDMKKFFNFVKDKNNVNKCNKCPNNRQIESSKLPCGIKICMVNFYKWGK